MKDETSITLHKFTDHEKIALKNETILFTYLSIVPKMGNLSTAAFRMS